MYTHISVYMEMSQRNQCTAILNKQKCNFFLLQNQGIGGQDRFCSVLFPPNQEIGPVGEKRRWRKGVGQ
jgi:hypothetical protein